jgi:hypothetical protein
MRAWQEQAQLRAQPAADEGARQDLRGRRRSREDDPRSTMAALVSSASANNVAGTEPVWDTRILCYRELHCKGLPKRRPQSA